MRVIILLFIMTAVISCSKDPEVRGYHLFTDMAYSPAYSPFSENEVTPNGITLMRPVEGTIARGQMPYPYSASKDDAVIAGRYLKDPYKKTQKSLKRGEVVFENYCVVCHGKSGDGTGIITRKGFPPPPSLVFGQPMEYSKGRIFHAVTVGYGDMPGHALQIKPKDRWYVAQYIKDLQGKAKKGE